jgi:hypothetical protein
VSTLPAPKTCSVFRRPGKRSRWTRAPGLRLGPSDCELVEQLRRDVLPYMSIRVDYDRLRCSTVFGNIGQPQLRVAALVALPEQH